ncbi:MAG: carbonic anhydrase, partial [Deltaproteobacteria bacterium]
VLGVTASSDTSASYMIDQVTARVGSARPAAVIIAASTCVAALLAMRFARRAPVTLVALAVAALVVRLAHLDIATLPDLPVRVPHVTPLALPAERYADFATLALALYALASLETFLSASADEQRDPGERNDPDQDLIGHGLANLALAFFGGLPATGSIVRTRALRAGDARTRLAPLAHALSAAALVPLVLAVDRWVSLAGLAGVVVAHAVRLLDPRPIAALWRVSKLHAGVSVVTAATMAFAGVLTGVETGLFFALVLAMVRVARFRATLHRGGEGAPHQVTFSGPATFLAVPVLERLRARLAPLDLTSGVIVDVRDVLVMDPTGCTQLVALVNDVADRGGNPAVLGLAPSCRAMVLAADRRGLVAPRLAVTDLDVDRIIGRERAYEMRALVVASLERFRGETRGHYESLFEQLADGQHPHTLFVTCVDSRVSPAMLTGAHPGEVFVVRCLGAMVPPPSEDAPPGEGAAIEYAVGVLGVRNIVVCGHSSCGAVKAVKSGHVPDELASLQRWLAKAPLAAGDLSTHANLDDAARAVTVKQIENLKQYPLVRDRLAKGEIRLHAWFYHLAEAELFEWNETLGTFEILAGPRASIPHDEPGRG